MKQCTQQSNHPINGFTLVEFVAVIIIISIISGYAVFRWSGGKSNTMAQSSRFIYDLRYAQSLAMSKGLAYRINILSGNSYNITDVNGTIIPQPTTNNATITLDNGATFSSITNLPNNVISFDTHGVPYIDATATTTLTATATITISIGSNGYTIAINPETGHSAIQ